MLPTLLSPVEPMAQHVRRMSQIHKFHAGIDSSRAQRSGVLHDVHQIYLACDNLTRRTHAWLAERSASSIFWKERALLDLAKK